MIIIQAPNDINNYFFFCLVVISCSRQYLPHNLTTLGVCKFLASLFYNISIIFKELQIKQETINIKNRKNLKNFIVSRRSIKPSVMTHWNLLVDNIRNKTWFEYIWFWSDHFAVQRNLTEIRKGAKSTFFILIIQLVTVLLGILNLYQLYTK